MLDLNWKEKLLWGVNIFFQQLVLLIVVCILWPIFEHIDIKSAGAWHIILCTLGYALFMAEAVVLFMSSNIITTNLNRKIKGYVHGVLMTLATIFVTAGIALKIQQKNEAIVSEHFQTDHAILGLVSWILVLIVALLGILVAFPKTFNFIKPVWFKLIHNFLGTSAYIIGMVALGFGLYKQSFANYSTENTRQALCWLIAIITFYTLFDALKSYINQLKTILKSGDSS